MDATRAERPPKTTSGEAAATADDPEAGPGKGEAPDPASPLPASPQPSRSPDNSGRGQQAVPERERTRIVNTTGKAALAAISAVAAVILLVYVMGGASMDEQGKPFGSTVEEVKKSEERK